MEDEDSVLFDSDLVFHYTSGTVGLHNIASKGALRLSVRANSDDPHENLPPRIGATAVGTSEEQVDRLLMLALEARSAIISQFKGFQGIHQASFCRNMDPPTGSPNLLEGRGFARPRMWSQYGDHHRGVCLAFSRQWLEEYATAANTDTDRYYFGNVQYRGFPVLNHLKTHVTGGDVEATGLDDFVAKMTDEQWEELLLTKHRDYEHENEFKICAALSSPSEVFIPVHDAIRAIVLGTGFPEAFYPAAVTVGRDMGVPVFLITWGYAQPFLVDLENHRDYLRRLGDTT